MTEKKRNPRYVRRPEFNKRFGKVELALFGADGRGGIVKDIGDIKGSVKVIERWRIDEVSKQKQQKRDYRGLIYSVVGGAIVAIISWILSTL